MINFSAMPVAGKSLALDNFPNIFDVHSAPTADGSRFPVPEAKNTFSCQGKKL